VVDFLKQLRRSLKGKLLIIWDQLTAHRSRIVRDYVDSTEGALQLAFLPAYAPELNPVEYLWSHWKQHELGNFCPKTFAELTDFARRKLLRSQRRPAIIAACWRQAELAL
jgi:transposase